MFLFLEGICYIGLSGYKLLNGVKKWEERKNYIYTF